MPSFRCPSCSAAVQTAQSSTPLVVSCPECTRPMTLPAADPAFACPECGERTPFRAEDAGKLMRCARCRVVLTLPEPAPQHTITANPPPSATSPWPRVAVVALALAGLIGVGIAAALWLAPSQPDPVPVGLTKGAEDARQIQETPSTWKVAPAGTVSDLDFLRGASRAVISLRVADVWATPLVQELWQRVPAESREQADLLASHFGFDIRDVERVSAVVYDPTKPDSRVVIRLSRPWDQERRERFLVQARDVGWQRKQHAGLDYWEATVGPNVPSRPEEPLAVYVAADDVFVLGPPWSILRMLDEVASGKPLSRGELDEFIDSLVKERPHLLLASTVTEEDFAGFPFSDFRKMRRLSFSATFDDEKLSLRETFRCTDADGAKAIEDTLKKARATVGLLSSLGEWVWDYGPGWFLGKDNLLIRLVKLVTGAEIQCEGVDVRLVGKLETRNLLKYLPRSLPADFIPYLDGPSGARSLRQIALALDAYHAANDRYPPLVHNAPDGRALYGWRVCLLPYLGREEKELHAKLDRNKAWNEGGNAKLLERMPTVFSHPMILERDRTPFQLLTGPGGSFRSGATTTKATIRDGLGRTLLLVATRKAVPWAAPGNDIEVPADAARVEKELLPTLGLFPTLSIGAALFDQKVRQLPRTMTGREFLDAARPDDGAGLGR